MLEQPSNPYNRSLVRRFLKLPAYTTRRIYHAGRHHYLPKMKGGRHPLPPQHPVLYVLATWIGAIVAFSSLYGLSFLTDSVMIMAPFGATCVLVFGAPDSPLAQPRNVVCGHVLATAIALIFAHFLGDSWWVITLSVATVIAVMQLTRTLHPPAGADPIIVILTHAPFSFILVPVLAGAIIFVLCGVITNNLFKDRHYPKYWW
ncbi:MAG: hypothetical protein K0R98_1082 [Rickettsiaceae bacterium]|jgi:CBS-domain-containing membrane protein|nr:hypothetical protein [Rickettsiaceae bacterium]